MYVHRNRKVEVNSLLLVYHAYSLKTMKPDYETQEVSASRIFHSAFSLLQG